jgi:hypothetical protein
VSLHISFFVFACSLLQYKTRGTSPFFASKRNDFHFDFSGLALENELHTLLRPSKMSHLPTVDSTDLYTYARHTYNKHITDLKWSHIVIFQDFMDALFSNKIKMVDYFGNQQCSGSVTFWYGSRSLDPWIRTLDLWVQISLFSSLTSKLPTKISFFPICYAYSGPVQIITGTDSDPGGPITYGSGTPPCRTASQVGFS